MTASALPRLALVGDHGNHNEPSHPRLDELTPHWPVEAVWLPTEEIRSAFALDGFDGVYVVPGAPYHNQRGVHLAVRHAREQGLPFLGTCGGFFSALLEHAENVLRLEQVVGVTEDPDRMTPLITPLTCSFHGETAPLVIREGSRLSAVYGGATKAEEVFHCAYGLAESLMREAGSGALRFSAWDSGDAPRALELDGHPFFVGTLFQPELVSTPQTLHPVLGAFLDAVVSSASARRGSPS